MLRRMLKKLVTKIMGEKKNKSNEKGRVKEIKHVAEANLLETENVFTNSENLKLAFVQDNIPVNYNKTSSGGPGNRETVDNSLYLVEEVQKLINEVLDEQLTCSANVNVTSSTSEEVEANRSVADYNPSPDEAELKSEKTSCSLTHSDEAIQKLTKKHKQELVTMQQLMLLNMHMNNSFGFQNRFTFH